MEMPRNIEEVRGGPGRIPLRLTACLALLLVLLCGGGAANDARGPSSTGPCGGPKYVVLFIGDGMGFEQVRAAGMYENGEAGTLFFESFPHRGEVATHSSSGPVTDSAATATAMATGRKVSNGVISMAIPGDKGPLETVLEKFKACGRSTGLVSTAYITHATPAAFASHEPSRDNHAQIAADYLDGSRPSVLFGGARYITPKAAWRAGYAVVTSKKEMLALDTESATMVSGQFSSGHMPYEATGYGMDIPHLSEMTSVALRILDNDPDGLFLMVEGGRIDHAGHENNIRRNVLETVEFERAVRAAYEWADGRAEDTAIIVIADHETGGLSVVAGRGRDKMPDVRWSTHGHTGANVPVYSWGLNAALVNGVMDNTYVFDVMTK